MNEEEKHTLLCKHCSVAALTYVDEVTILDRRMEAIISLLKAGESTSEILNDVVPVVGEMVEEYLERRRLLDHVVVGRLISEYHEEEWQAAELKRLQHKFDEAVARHHQREA